MLVTFSRSAVQRRLSIEEEFKTNFGISGEAQQSAPMAATNASGNNVNVKKPKKKKKTKDNVDASEQSGADWQIQLSLTC